MKSTKIFRGFRGFTLIELMVVVAIVAILVALAMPAYTRYVLKAKRGEAQQLLMNWANNQEVWRSTDSDYATDTEILPPTHEVYTFTISNRAANSYTLTATAKTGTTQVDDKEGTTSCTPLSIDQSNNKTPAACW